MCRDVGNQRVGSPFAYLIEEPAAARRVDGCIIDHDDFQSRLNQKQTRGVRVRAPIDDPILCQALAYQSD